MKLYDYPKSGNGYKVRLLLAHLNMPYEYIPLDILQGETRTTEFLQKNPNGRVSLLELDDGTFLPESKDACRQIRKKSCPSFFHNGISQHGKA